MPKKKANPIAEVWIEKIGNQSFKVHVSYEANMRIADKEYQAHSFEQAQKIYCAVTNEDYEELRNYDVNTTPFRW